MELLKEYKQYVSWCAGSGAHPIGFVNWKGRKFGYTWDSKKHIYVKNE